MPANKVKLELSVHDSGKVCLDDISHRADATLTLVVVRVSARIFSRYFTTGISLGRYSTRLVHQNQLFHPFSQENPLQTGTGLGLAIVNSIVHSESVNGKVDVWSEEGVGTEIKIIFLAEVPDDIEDPSPEMEPMKFSHPDEPPTISLVGFDESHVGVQRLRNTLANYLVTWWGFRIQPTSAKYGDIVIIDDDPFPVVIATEKRDTHRPFIILTASRGSPHIMSVATDHERVGGFCRIVHKPGGPSRLGAVLKLCLHARHIGTKPSTSSTGSEASINGQVQHEFETKGAGPHILRRHSVEQDQLPGTVRPAMTPRSTTAGPVIPSWTRNPVTPSLLPTITSTISVGSGGTLLKSSMGTIDTTNRQFRVLVMEDNSILRNLLYVVHFFAPLPTVA